MTTTLRTMLGRRTATALTVPLLLVGGLASCAQDDARPTAGNGSQMQDGPRSDLDSPGSLDAQLRDDLGRWCQDLLGDRSWSQLDPLEHAELVHAMHTRMDSRRDDGLTMWQRMSGSWMTSRTTMTRSCRDQ